LHGFYPVFFSLTGVQIKADQLKRGGQKKGTTEVNSEEHRGVRPGSTTQDKGEREKRAERSGDKSRVGKGDKD
jgi:hypothetical protein